MSQPVKQYKLILVGLGTVSQGLLNLLQEKAELLRLTHSVEFKIIAACTGHRGNLHDSDGFDIQELLELATSSAPFSKHATDLKTEALIRTCGADILVELSPTNLSDGQPAISYCRAAFESNMHVVSANKGPATLAYRELSLLAKEHNLSFLNEATVLSGTPVFSFARSSLAGITIHKIAGILNGSTNFILGEMEQGASYAAALETAKNAGYLEADPRGDVDGHDAQAKVAILANALLGLNIKLDDVGREGIAQITLEDIKTATAADERWKLVATLSQESDQVVAEVKLQRLPLTHPLAQISGTTNALTFSTDLLGEITVSGPGAGGRETGYAILSDLLTINKGNQ